MKFILGKKLEMSQIFDKDSRKVIPVTLIEAGPCVVIDIKTKNKDGYRAFQFGFRGRFKEAGPFRFLREARARKMAVRMEDKVTERSLKKGDQVDVSIFEKGDRVSIVGTSKGKGFAGAVKRWGFRDRAGHGIKKHSRTLGSTGSRYPQRVIKGRKMPGRMGFERMTVRNLEVVGIDKENNLLAVKGAVPGARGTLLEIKGR